MTIWKKSVSEQLIGNANLKSTLKYRRSNKQSYVRRQKHQQRQVGADWNVNIGRFCPTHGGATPRRRRPTLSDPQLQASGQSVASIVSRLFLGQSAASIVSTPSPRPITGGDLQGRTSLTAHQDGGNRVSQSRFIYGG